MSLAEDLSAIISGEVATDDATKETHSRDASIFKLVPQAVVYPKDIKDIKQLIHYVNEHKKEKLSITARSAGTDMSGGPLSESIVLDMSRYFINGPTISDHQATVQPGVFYREFEKATLEKNLILPSYPASRQLCTVGGMVNNNSGGEKTLSYGKTEKYVKSLKMILRDGEEYTFEPLTFKQLAEKMELQTVEGDVYRRIVELIDKNEAIIKAAKPMVSKNSTGYSLWNVFNERTQLFDITQLIIGSQGTLGITTEVTFKLITPKPHTQMLVMFLENTNDLADIVTTTLRYQPESFESYDDHTLGLAIKYLPEMAKQMGASSLISLTWQMLPEFGLILTSGFPKLILMAEFAGYDKEEVRRRAKACQFALQQFPIKTRLTKNEKETKKYWTIRRESFNLLRKKIRHKHTAPFIDDLTVHPQVLPEFLPRLNEIMSHYDLTYTVAGHVGDGNFHIIPLMDFTNEKQRDIIPELSEKVYDLVFSLKGSMSGEHNDGLIRSHYLEKMYGKEVYELFVQVKKIFDPDNIFNPGKKVGSDWEYALKHVIQE